MLRKRRSIQATLYKNVAWMERLVRHPGLRSTQATSYRLNLNMFNLLKRKKNSPPEAGKSLPFPLALNKALPKPVII